MKIYEKGFGAVGTLVVLIAVGLTGMAGWYVWNENKKQPTSGPQQMAQSETSKTNSSGRVGANDNISDPTDIVSSYTLPQGWKEKECKPGMVAIMPPKTVNPNCSADQPNMIVSLY